MSAPPVAGGWGAWSAWSACSQTCDAGTQTRQRACNNPIPANGGAMCVGLASETQACDDGPCFMGSGRGGESVVDQFRNYLIVNIDRTGLGHGRWG